MAAEEPLEPVDFRVHTTVVAQEDHRVVAENLTVFSGQSIYDFPLNSPTDATVFDARTNQFTLLDARRKVQCQLSGRRLLQLIAALEQRAGNASNPQIRFAASPSFRERFDPGSLHLTLAAKPLTYAAIGKKPEFLGAVGQYRQFADWFARLNATEYPMPPAARLCLNRALAKRQLLPVRIWRQTPGQKTYTSKQVFGWQLEKKDLQRVDQVRQWSERFHPVSLDQFRRRQHESATP